jgi:hypothetical protein
MCAAPASRKTCAAVYSEAPLVITSSTSTTRRPRSSAARSGSTWKAPLTLASRSLRLSWLCGRVCRRAAAVGRRGGPDVRVCRASAAHSSQAWLKPRDCRRCADSGTGSSQSSGVSSAKHLGKAGRLQQQAGKKSGPAVLLAEFVAGNQGGPGVGVAHAGEGAVQRRRLDGAGAAHRRAGPKAHGKIGRQGEGAARAARCTGCAKRATQGPHTWRAGQLRQTAHWLAMPEAKPGKAGAGMRGGKQAGEHRVNILAYFSAIAVLSFFFPP